MKKIAAGFLAVALLAGFAAPAKASEKEGLGLILGALGGGVAGHQFGQGKGNTWATAIGAVAGAVAGQSIGASLDRADYAYYNNGRRGYSSAPTFTTYEEVYYQPRYKKHKHRHHYATAYYVPSYEQRVNTVQVVPASIVDNSLAGRYCREYQQQVTVGGRAQGSYGTACLQPDGDWELVK